jgi:hypothetical protein
LNWQIVNQSRNLKYVKLNQSILRLVIFIDSFFVNNHDFSSQIDYVICLTDSINTTNIIHWSSVKCKRITRSVLAIELFAMIHDFDVDSVLKATLTKMLDVVVFLILATNSKSLYDCLVRLRTTIEKRLMIDVMIFRQFYERREITEMIWIHEINNSTNFMIKTKFSSTLKTMIDINKINLNTTEWVKRAIANQRKKIAKIIEWDEKFQRDESIFQRDSNVSIKVRRYDATSRVVSLITWLTLDEHYI